MACAPSNTIGCVYGWELKLAMDQVTVLFAALQKLLPSVSGRMHTVVIIIPCGASNRDLTLGDNWELADV